jgi:hypothetical protein
VFSLDKEVSMDEKQAGLGIMFAGIAVAFGWLIFFALWLFFYASSFSIVQNIAVFLLSLAVAAILETVIWIPWAMKHAD